jgi:hypothetical protein
MALAFAPATTTAGLTEQMQQNRMTVVKVDPAAGRFMCAEHLRWTPVAKSDLAAVQPGDIVKVDRNGGAVARLVLLRAAADELTSPAQ